MNRNAVALDRIRMGRAARPSVLYGLRGVGKTVLLVTMRDAAEVEGTSIFMIEAPENRSLPGILVRRFGRRCCGSTERSRLQRGRSRSGSFGSDSHDREGRTGMGFGDGTGDR
ncbi:ATP-binding protein [Sphingobium cloacae]|uniref:Orc1-like AAA ATPase domain-containing protein n=1 Tax=Sphingobium cloacae TaxID=120107 RepID=A0A1E1EY18_9SPHN|nr:ATP-binding protein [Sphingobium cloacae]BAV63165.1 hypothetical protein SCLO_1001250 [Sphingobium cloacae]